MTSEVFNAPPLPTLLTFIPILCGHEENARWVWSVRSAPQRWWAPEGNRAAVASEKHAHAQERGINKMRRKQNDTAETNRKYTKYTGVFITVCKHLVLHFKNATIELLAHLCTKQINCNACYKALFVKIQTLIPGGKKGKSINIIT